MCQTAGLPPVPSLRCDEGLVRAPIQLHPGQRARRRARLWSRRYAQRTSSDSATSGHPQVKPGLRMRLGVPGIVLVRERGLRLRMSVPVEEVARTWLRVCRPQMTLPQFLNRYKYEPALSVHWVLVGPSGQHARPPSGGVLRHYTHCAGEGSHVIKTIANTYYLSNTAGHAHNAEFRCALSTPPQRPPSRCVWSGLWIVRAVCGSWVLWIGC